MKNKTISIVAAIFIISILVAALVYFVRSSHQKDREMKEVVEMMNFEKEQLESEYTMLTNELGSYVPNLQNDSLLKLLDSEKLKIKQLLEELRLTKATNMRRINELKDELASVRKVMVHYVQQIDSLNAQNERLTSENIEVRRMYEEASETAEQLAKEKESLGKIVSKASVMEISNFEMALLNKKNRKTTRISQASMVEFAFTLSKNVVVEPGKKTIYIRVIRPDNVLLSKGQGHVFPFEDKEIEYSAKKEIEYANESIQDVIYWKVDEILPAGMYRTDFFLDGNRIGCFAFELKK